MMSYDWETLKTTNRHDANFVFTGDTHYALQSVNKRDGVSNHRRLDCLLNCFMGRRSKKTSKLRVTGLCGGNPPVTGGFPSQRASNAENVSIWWRHHEYRVTQGGDGRGRNAANWWQLNWKFRYSIMKCSPFNLFIVFMVGGVLKILSIIVLLVYYACHMHNMLRDINPPTSGWSGLPAWIAINRNMWFALAGFINSQAQNVQKSLADLSIPKKPKGCRPRSFQHNLIICDMYGFNSAYTSPCDFSENQHCSNSGWCRLLLLFNCLLFLFFFCHFWQYRQILTEI